MQGAMESCPFKTVLSGGMGFALGGAFGLFMSSVSLQMRTGQRLSRWLIVPGGLPDELRHSNERCGPAARRSTTEGATATGLQGHGDQVV